MTTTYAAPVAPATAVLIPTHTTVCISDGSVIFLTDGPYGRCVCDVLTPWVDAVEAVHICLDCQGDLDWGLPFPVAGI